MTREALVAEKRHKASIGLVWGRPPAGVEDGHQAVVTALSARADGARNIGLALNGCIEPVLGVCPIPGLIVPA